MLQTFLAPMSQVFPAEDDVNKHVDDNCELLAPRCLYCEVIITIALLNFTNEFCLRCVFSSCFQVPLCI